MSVGHVCVNECVNTWQLGRMYACRDQGPRERPHVKEAGLGFGRARASLLGTEGCAVSLHAFTPGQLVENLVITVKR